MFASPESIEDVGARRLDAADEFDDYVDLRVVQDRRDVCGLKARLYGDVALACEVADEHTLDLDAGAEARLDRSPIISEETQAAGADVAEAEHTEDDPSHDSRTLTSADERGQRLGLGGAPSLRLWAGARRSTAASSQR